MVTPKIHRSSSHLLLAILASAAPRLSLARSNAPATPEECLVPVAQAEALGKAMYVQDAISAWATDAVLREHPRDARVRGWVTVLEGARWVVEFYALEQAGTVVLYTVRFERPAPDAAKVVAWEPPLPVSGEVATLIRARDTGVREPFEPRCSALYNSIVLPAAIRGEEGWLVYLLAATTEPGVVVFGGHHRRLVSRDGTKMVRSEPFSRACPTLPASTDPNAVGAWVTHIVSPCPVEIHVFLSLLHKRPLYVVTSTGRWLIEEGRIRFGGPLGRRDGDGNQP